MAGLLCSGVAIAQTPRTFNLYVDPIQGDDVLAQQLNPFGSTAVPNLNRPLQTHPGVPGTILGELQHAGYAFRTVTAAVAWVAKLPVVPPATARLPYTNPNTEEIVGWVVIHCLPGLYGPRDPGTPSSTEDYDTRSGLPWNGETFPIGLPDRVSIQGTSALDTIFDARGYDVLVPGGQAIFLIDSGPPGATPDWSGTFIDAVTLRGCRNGGPFPSGSAIAIKGSKAVLATIGNCFIYANDVGIGVEDLEEEVHHAPRIVNNTIAWNQIGIWVGDKPGQPLSTGLALPIVLNNLIDPIRPVGASLPPYFQGVGAGTAEAPSCFEGLDAADLTATVVGPGCNQTQNFNSYDVTLSNRKLASSWPFGSTQPRTTTPIPLPVVDLSPWTGTWNAGAPIRGDLYVRDVFATASMACAPHDFRLGPMTRLAGTTNTVRNPLVNQGITHLQGIITFGNGGQIGGPPGIPNDDLASFNVWDWDCEGFGNPRVAARRNGHTAHFPTPWCNSTIDLGADEMGELIMSGFLDSTRIFSRPHPGVASHTSTLAIADYVYFLNVYAIGGGGPLSYIAPQFNVRGDLVPLLPPSGSPEWYAQLGPNANPFLVTSLGDPPLPFAFTGGGDQQLGVASPSTRLVLTAPALNPNPTTFPRFMRSRICDSGPHLLDDIEPLANPILRAVDYAEFVFFAPWSGLPPRLDIFQVNPWYDMVELANYPGSNDNKYLYVDGVSQRLRHGTLNPPLTVSGDPVQAMYPSSYLFRDPPRHNIYYWAPPTYTYAVATNGLSLGYPVYALPNVGWYGYRMNQELYDPDNPAWSGLGSPANNLQTSLVVQGEDATGGRRVAPPELSPDPPSSSLEALRREVEAVLLDQVRRARR